MSKSAPRAGTVLSERYELVELLGRGGMGSVWRAKHLSLDSPCAVKLIDGSVAQDAAAAERFKREAQASAALRSPHVVQILDFGVDAGTPYLVMELLEGESLGARLERRGRLLPAETAKIVREVARALGKAHELGVIHRDIKPDNVFLTRVDHDEITKLLDFGIAKVRAVSALTRTGAVIGTPRYMSPEQVESRTLDARSDLWSLGVVAFECFVGRAPFDADTIPELVLQICARPAPVPSHMAAVPAGFDAWFARAVARNPAERFASAREMAEALAAIAEKGPSADPVAATATFESTSRWKGGDARAGFEIASDVPTLTLHLKFWGFWDLALTHQFRTAVYAGYDRFGGKKFVILSDATGWVPQKPDVQEVHKETMKMGFARGLSRVGAVVNSALSQMQIRRMFEEAGSPPSVKFTSDAAEARAWIER